MDLGASPTEGGEFIGCTDDIPVTFFAIVDGGHTWPSSDVGEDQIAALGGQESKMTTIKAGWYNDPSVPGQLRWWDGAAWTDHVHVSADVARDVAANTAGSQIGSAPFVVGQEQNWGAQTPGYSGGASETVNDLGAWIGAAFRTPLRQFGPLLGIFSVQMVVWPFVWLLIDSGLTGATFGDAGFQGVDGAPLVTAAAVAVVGFFLFVLGHLAKSHNLYSSWVGHRATFGQSMEAGLRSLPRTIGYGLLLLLGLLAANVALILAIITIAFASEVAALLAFLVVSLLSTVGAVYFGVKLGMFDVAAAVAPPGHSPILASWRTSRGFFWGVFGRILLLVLLVYIPQQIVGATIQAMFLGTAAEIFSNGPRLGAGDFIEFDQLLPNPIRVGVALVVLGLVNLIFSSFIVAGRAGLYADLGGPNTFGHHRRGRTF